MAETVRFHFDPACPWAWQSSIWMRAAARVRAITVDWRLFSLKTINSPDGARDGISPALRTLAVIRREAGSDGVDALYRALGARTHDGGEKLTHGAIRASLEDAGFAPDLLNKALEDETTIADVRADHDRAVGDVGAFGVPTIVLPSGKGIFGPVVAEAPDGESAGELWDHVRYLAELDGFYEVKRNRDRRPGSA